MEKIKTIAAKVLLPLVVLWPLASTGEAATTQVDCPSSSLQAAIDKAKPGDTLLVTGSCKENLTILEETVRVVLDGQRNATISGPDASKANVVVRGRGITIKGFTITGGRDGIEVTQGGYALIDGNTLQGAARSGITVNRGSGTVILNNTVQNNGVDGIAVTGISDAIVGFRSIADKTASPNIVQNNGRNGVRVARSSTARIIGNTITDNKRAGVAIEGASQADIGANTINANGGDGILVAGNSMVNLGSDSGSGLFQRPNTSGAPNSGFGIRCSINSSADGRLGALNGSKGAKDFTETGCIDSLIP